jgi:hypothetical protein
MRTTSCASLTSVLAVALLAAATRAQQWQLMESSGPGAGGGGIAYDEARGQLVRFGGRFANSFTHSVTSLFDGALWTHGPPSGPAGTFSGPTSVPYSSSPILMDWDPVRRAVLLCNELAGDMWQWNGAGWTQIVASPHPAPGDGTAFAFDRARGVAVFMGASGTWEWNGSAWTHSAATTPAFVAAAFMPTHGKVAALANRDVFEWTGSAWTQVTNNLLATAAFPSLPNYAMSFDSWRQRLVIFDTLHQGNVYEWDGVNLTTFSPAGGPPARTSAAAAFDPSRGLTVLSGGESTNLARSDTWGWNGTAWTELATSPGAGTASLAFDATRNRLVAAGITDFQAPSFDTWERDASGWHRIANAFAGPGPMVFDSLRGRVAICRAGQISYWNGTTWAATAPTTTVPARTQFCAAYDAARREIVLFGGIPASSPNPLADTWLWSGSNWRQAAPTTSPAARSQSAMAFDTLRQRSVLFGGSDAQRISLDDTWEWDGTNWVADGPATRPMARARHAMAWEPLQQRVAMTGGTSITLLGGAPLTLNMPAELWSYDGVDWAVTPISAPVLADHAMTFDGFRNRLVIQGGYAQPNFTATGSGLPSSDKFELVVQPGSASSLPASPCPGISQFPVLRPESWPVLGNPRFAVNLVNATANSPAVFGISPTLAITTLTGGCQWWAASGVTVFAITNPGGSARLAMPVPNRTALIGQRVVTQMAGLDPTGRIILSSVALAFVGE